MHDLDHTCLTEDTRLLVDLHLLPGSGEAAGASPGPGSRCRRTQHLGPDLWKKDGAPTTQPLAQRHQLPSSTLSSTMRQQRILFQLPSRRTHPHPLSCIHTTHSSDKAEAQSEADIEVIRKVKAVLNKISEQNFDKLATQLLGSETGISKPLHIEILMREIFDKVTTQHSYDKLYTKLCLRISEWSVGEGRQMLKEKAGDAAGPQGGDGGKPLAEKPAEDADKPAGAESQSRLLFEGSFDHVVFGKVLEAIVQERWRFFWEMEPVVYSTNFLST